MSGQRVGIVGSRTWARPQDVSAYVAALPPATMVLYPGETWLSAAIDGGVRATNPVTGIECTAYLLERQRDGQAASFRRAQRIVEDSDRIVAFAAKDPTTKGITAGTSMTIDLARKAGVPVGVIPSPVPASLCVLLYRLRGQLTKVRGESNQGRKRAMTKRLLALAAEVVECRDRYERRLNDGYAEIATETDDGEKERKEGMWLNWLRTYEACCDALAETEVVL